MISSYIFRRIFKSQATNIDTICCIACHIINYIMSNFTQSGAQADASLDVTEKTGAGGGGGDKGGGAGKGGKGAQGGDKAGGPSVMKRA